MSSVPSVGSPAPAASQQTPKKSVTPTKVAKPKSMKTTKPKPKVSKPKSPKVTKPKASKVKIAKAPSNHPTYNSMIKKAIAELNEKKGSSRPAILKYLMSHYQLGENPMKVNASLKLGLKRGVESGELKQVKGVGASGSFRLGVGRTSKKSDVKSPKKRAIAKKPSVKKATPKKAKKAVPKKPPVAKKARPAVAAKPEATAPVLPAASKPKTAKTPKKTIAKKSKTVKKAPKTIVAKKSKTPKKMAGGVKKPKSTQ